jgi:hypothetical protein
MPGREWAEWSALCPAPPRTRAPKHGSGHCIGHADRDVASASVVMAHGRRPATSSWAVCVTCGRKSVATTAAIATGGRTIVWVRRSFNALNVCDRNRADSAVWAEEPTGSGVLSGADPTRRDDALALPR